jgi:hypothetical protein
MLSNVKLYRLSVDLKIFNSDCKQINLKNEGHSVIILDKDLMVLITEKRN